MTQQQKTNLPPHPRVLIKGNGYVQPFLAGAGGFDFEIEDYQLASTFWVFCKTKEWFDLYIKFEKKS